MTDEKKKKKTFIIDMKNSSFIDPRKVYINYNPELIEIKAVRFTINKDPNVNTVDNTKEKTL